MRRATLFVVGYAVLALALAAPVHATDFIQASSTVLPTQDPGFAGLYKYVITVTWSLDSHDLSHLDLFLDLSAFGDRCDAGGVLFPLPAGTSSGEDLAGGICALTYQGLFLCKTDPSIPYTALGATVKFEPLETDCFAGQQGSGRFVFYSPIAPAVARVHPDAVAIKHGQEVDFGALTGSLPHGAGEALATAAPVVINEFLVRPYGDQHEFVEAFNNTAQPVDLGGWTIEVFNRDYSLSSYTQFPPGTILGPGGFATRFDTDFTQYCPSCPSAPVGIDGAAQAAAAVDILFDAGGQIYLKDPSGAIIDQVAYGNMGGAPISCPIVVPPGYPLPPGFGGATGGDVQMGYSVLVEGDTLATSTNRYPDGTDTNIDSQDFAIGSPTPDASNLAIQANLGGSARINSVYVWPKNNDADPVNESVQFYNPTSQTKDLRGLELSDGYLIQPIFPPGDPILLEPLHSYTVYHGLNGTIGFEFEEDDRMDLYEPGSTGLVRIDQLGWSRLPAFFPDSCFTRVPDGTGPSGGWDWDTSGGFVTLFYVNGCALEAPNVAVGDAVPHTALRSAWPNPARDAARFEFEIAGSGVVPAQVGVFDVAGRRVGEVGSRSYGPGHYLVTWDGVTLGGHTAAPGVYFARLFVAGQPTGPARPVVWLGR